jgi:DNA repair exonuclease SbcCD nuclease subunit
VKQPIRIIHSADWQIGKQFGNIPGDAAAAVRLQRLTTVERIAQQAKELAVDAVLVAGDVFEHNGVADETLRRTVNAMSAYTGPWVLLPGNHDAALAESVWSRLQRLGLVSDNIHLAIRTEPIILCDQRLAILPAPLMRRHETRDLTAAFDQMITPPGAIRIGLAHGSVKNRLPERSEAYNEIADDRADRARLDYLALGDWHGTLEIAPRTWYAGTPEPDRFRNNQPGNLLLVSFAENAEPMQVEVITCGHFQWTQLAVTLYQDEDIDALAHRLSAIDRPERQLIRLQLSGSIDLAVKQRLDRVLEQWKARFHHLEGRDSELKINASQTDIEQLGAQGFVREAIEKLQHLAAQENSPDSDAAQLALQILYHQQQSLAEKS